MCAISSSLSAWVTRPLDCGAPFSSSIAQDGSESPGLLPRTLGVDRSARWGWFLSAARACWLPKSSSSALVMFVFLVLRASISSWMLLATGMGSAPLLILAWSDVGPHQQVERNDRDRSSLAWAPSLRNPGAIITPPHRAGVVRIVVVLMVCDGLRTGTKGRGVP